MVAQNDAQKLLSLLRTRGLVAAGELVRELGISRSTLARKLSALSGNLAAVGQTRSQHYGLLRAVAGLASELPLFRVNESGKIQPTGKLMLFDAGISAVEPRAQIFTALPPEISDMAPQGFMGRAFAKRFAAELGLSPRLEDWSDDHVLSALAKRGEDQPGNVIVGKESAERGLKLSRAETARSSYIDLAKRAYAEQPAGSSAGGERPKFSVIFGGRHKLVKFAGPLRDPSQKRWGDLLYCEALAARVLARSGLKSAECQIWQKDDHVFLEVERFDRVGPGGRRPFLSLAAVDGYFHGDRDNWASAGTRLRRDGLLAESAANELRLVDAFARLIGDSDRHFYNIGFFPRFKSEESFLPEHIELAPFYDKLPMLFAPIDGRLVEREFAVELPDAELVASWAEATALAKTFWDLASKEKAISAGFRQIAKKCLSALVTNSA